MADRAVNRTAAAATTEPITATAGPSRSSKGSEEEAPGEKAAIHRRGASTARALLLARMHEDIPRICPRPGGEIRIFVFITDAGAVCEILANWANRRRCNS